MSPIHDKAWDGSLDSNTIKDHLGEINIKGGINDVTPLAAACWGGHLNVVKLLLANSADPNGLSPYSRTPFFFTTTRTPPPDRGAIVQALIDARADINLPCDEDRNTPLMNAITQIKDKDVIHLFVDNNALLTPTNVKNETAEMLAKKNGMERHLRPKSERNTPRAKVVDLLVSLVLLIISYVNSNTVKQFVGGLVKNLYDISGTNDPKLLGEIQNPQTPGDFKSNLNKYIQDNTFKNFFSSDDPFLTTLAEKASALTQDSTTDLGKPENIKRLTRLSLYQPVIYCDDSTSMSIDNRYTNQKELVTRIARIATKIVPDELAGVELHFINSRSSSKLDAQAIGQAMDSVTPSGGTKIGTNLRNKILEPLVYKVIPTKTDANPIPLKRPILVCIITDGDPSAEPVDTLQKNDCGMQEKLEEHDYEPTAVMFLISQIGTDKNAAAFLKGIRDDPRLQEVTYCTTDQLDKEFEKLKEHERGLESWLLHLLTSPIMNRHEA